MRRIPLRNLFLIVARNSFFGAFGKLSVKVISVIFTIFIVRWLGDESFGQYSLIWSYILIFAMLSDAGLGMYTIRELAKKKSNSHHLVGNIIAIRTILAIMTIALIMVTAWFLGYSEQFLLYVFLASTILLLYAVQDPLDTVLQAYERFDLAATAVIGGQLVFVGAGMILLLLGWHITGLIIAALLNVFVAALLAWRLMTGYRANLRWRLQPALWPGFIRASFSFGLIKLWLSWALRIDTVILAWFWLDEMVGWYSAAYAIILGIMIIPNSLNAALYPSLSRQNTQDPKSLPKTYEPILKYLFVISLPIAGGVSLVADKVVSLIYGAEFAPAAVALSILIWSVPFAFVSEFLRYTLLVTDRERGAVWALGLAVLFGIVLNLWLIPIYGFLAAAIMVVISEVLLTILYVRQLSSDLKSVNFSDVLLKPIFATAALMIVVSTFSSSSLGLQILLGSVTYIALIWALRVLKPDEVKLPLYLLKPTRKKPPAFMTTAKFEGPPLISIFIPAYNAAQFLAQAIESVLAQTYQNYELIIVDDGSTDGTTAILKQYQSHPKIIIHHNPKNVGMTTNWNIGLGFCQGELIAKLDADDFYEPNYLEAVIDFFQKHPEAGLVFSGLNLIYPDGRREPEMMFLRSWVRDRAAFLPSLLQLCVIRSPTVCVRRACYEQLGDFIEQMRIHADWEMWVRIATRYPVGFIARCLANYRVSYGTNVTARAVIDGRSKHDLQLWLNLLKKDEFLYRLTPKELTKFRWGIYQMEMHFAGIAAYYNQIEMQKTYTVFAEQVLPNQPSDIEMERMRQVYTNLHQGICAFRTHQLKEARHYFLQAIQIGPEYCKQLWIWNKLLLTFIGKTKWGIMYK